MWPSGLFGLTGAVCARSAPNRSGLLDDHLAIHDHPVAGKCQRYGDLKDTQRSGVSVPVHGNSRLNEAAAGSGEMRGCWPVLCKLNQFVANELRTVDIIHYPSPTGAALHVFMSLNGRRRVSGQEPGFVPWHAAPMVVLHLRAAGSVSKFFMIQLSPSFVYLTSCARLAQLPRFLLGQPERAVGEVS
jgi:hypothetical protein